MFSTEAKGFSELKKISSSLDLSHEDKLSLLVVPSKEQVLDFVRKILLSSRTNHEIALYALIILRRFLTNTSWTLRTTNWRSLFIVSVHVAHTIEANNEIFPMVALHKIYPMFTAAEFATLQRTFLACLDYRCFITLEDYDRYVQQHALSEI